MSLYFDQKSSFFGPKMNQEGSHVIISNVQKEKKVKYLNVDTRFQEEYNGSKFAECLCMFPQPIRGVTAISVVQAEIPYSFFNFSSAKGNSTFNYTNDTNEHNVALPSEYYSENDLITTLNEVLIDAVSFELVSQKLKISNLTDNEITLYWNVDSYNESSKYALKSRLGWCLGFRESSYVIESKQTLTAEAVLDMNTTRYLFLVVDEFSSNPNSFATPMSKSYINNVLARITIDPSVHKFGEIITNPLYLTSDTRTYASPIDLQKLKIAVMDEWGNPVDLNLLDFSFCLKVVYE